MSVKKSKGSLLAALGIGLMAVSCLSFPITEGVSQQPLFVAGREGYVGFRIPALVQAQGRLFAFAEGRVNGFGDSGNIDLVMKYSDDGGKRWSPLIRVWDEGENSCVSPTPVAVPLPNGGTRLLMVAMHHAGEDHATEMIAKQSKGKNEAVSFYSDDNGKSWSTPQPITPAVADPAWVWMATAPGAGVCLQTPPHAGRILVPAAAYNTETHRFVSFLLYSDDNGTSWNRGAVGWENTSLCQLTELPDGTVWIQAQAERDAAAAPAPASVAGNAAPAPASVAGNAAPSGNANAAPSGNANAAPAPASAAGDANAAPSGDANAAGNANAAPATGEAARTGRLFWVSRDGGLSFTEPAFPQADLPDLPCHAALLCDFPSASGGDAAAPVGSLLDSAGRSPAELPVIYFASPENAPRSRMTLFRAKGTTGFPAASVAAAATASASGDANAAPAAASAAGGGRSLPNGGWEPVVTLWHKAAAYSALASDSDHLYLLYECGGKFPYSQVAFAVMAKNRLRELPPAVPASRIKAGK